MATSTLKGSAANPETTSTRESGSERQVGGDDRRNGYGNRDRQTRRDEPALSALASAVRGGISRRGGGEVVGELVSQFTEIIKQNTTWTDVWEIKLIALDHSVDSRLKISSIVMVVRDKASPETGVAYHNMLIAASAGTIPPKRIKRDRKEIQIVLTADNGNDATMAEVVEQAVTSAYPGVALTPVPSQTISTYVNIRNREHVERVLVNALLACTTYLTEQSGAVTMGELSKLADTMKFTASASFDSMELVNDVQVPVRADWCISLSKASKEQNNDSLGLNDGAETQEEVLSVYGYIDLAYVGILEDEIDARGREPTARYIPRIIVTQIRTGNYGYVGMVGIAIAMINLLRTNNIWMKAMPMATKPGSINDYGVLSMEIALDPEAPDDREPTTFKSDDEGRAKYNDYLKRLVYNRPQVCIDVPVCGPETQQLGFLADIAAGGEEGEIARAMFIDVMNGMTSNKFGAEIPADDPLLCFDNEVHLGTVMLDSKLVDKRAIAYVQVGNAALPNGNGPNNALAQWSETMVNKDDEIDELLDERLRIEQDLFGPINVVGTALRLECTAALLDGMSRAMKNSKFQPLLTGFQTNMESWSRTTFRGHTMSKGNAGDMFQRSRMGENRSGSDRDRGYGNRGYGGTRRNYN